MVCITPVYLIHNMGLYIFYIVYSTMHYIIFVSEG